MPANKKNSVIKRKHTTPTRHAVAVIVNLQRATKTTRLPSLAKFKSWVTVTLEHTLDIGKHRKQERNKTKRQNTLDMEKLEITIRLVSAKESAALNARYRHKENPTNVLSFPAIIVKNKSVNPIMEKFTEETAIKYLGDIAICIPIVAKEACEQNKTFKSHLAHLVIHGTLHCLGYTHDNKIAARLMEKTEREIMQQLGFANPYENSSA